MAGKGCRKENRSCTGSCEGPGSQTDCSEGETVLETEPSQAEKVSVMKMKEDKCREGIPDGGDHKNVDEKRRRRAV